MMENILDKFTTHFKRILIQAQNIAWQEQNQSIEPIHLLEAMLQQKGCTGTEVMQKQNVTLESAEFRKPERLNISLGTKPQDAWNMPQPSARSQRIIEFAVKTSYEYKHRYVGSEHLLMGLAKVVDPTIKSILERNGVNLKSLIDNIDGVLKSSMRFNAIQPDPIRDHEHGDELDMNDAQPTALDLYTTDLTSDDAQTTIDPVIGRAHEIERLIQILSRRTKNNPVLVGDPGVGKTAIIEGLAKKIVRGDVPDVLSDRRILMLDLSAVVAGTMYRGEFENRMKQIIDEIKSDPSIILFIDEIHTIIGTGSSAGSLDAANILKPALARGLLHCIGATTHEEYKKYIENDKALERRFQVVQVDEATEDETLDILRGIKRNYEKYHNVEITDDAIRSAVKLAGRYLTDKKLPDKAIDLVDEAASQLKVSKNISPETKRIKELEASLRAIQETKRDHILNENYTQALNLKGQEDIILQELKNLKSIRNKQDQTRLGSITAGDIARVVSQATHIPVTDLIASEKQQLIDLEKLLKKHVFGQDEAIAEIAQTLRRSRAGLADPRKPLGSFIFMGPSGVGKTETARVLAQLLFDNPDALIRVDMSEFSERFNVSKLIGAPAGYVGYKDANLLTDAVRKKPYSVVLFDEIEKAHPDVFNLLLPVLEDGYLTDAAGQKVNFRNTIIIMTSNVGLKEFTNRARVGFDLDDNTLSDQTLRMRDETTKALKEHFRPEFLNRIDRIVVFNPLNEQIAKKIVEREVMAVKKLLSQRGKKLAVEPSVVKKLVHEFKPEEGARSLKRAVQKLLTDELANAMLTGAIPEKQSMVTVKTKDDSISFTP